MKKNKYLADTLTEFFEVPVKAVHLKKCKYQSLTALDITTVVASFEAIIEVEDKEKIQDIEINFNYEEAIVNGDSRFSYSINIHPQTKEIDLVIKSTITDFLTEFLEIIMNSSKQKTP